MGSGSTSRPSARTPACASSHITLESQSKNWTFIWLTLSTLRVGCFQHPSPVLFHLLAFVLLIVLPVSEQYCSGPPWQLVLLASASASYVVPLTLFHPLPFCPHPFALSPLLSCHDTQFVHLVFPKVKMLSVLGQGQDVS